MRARTSYLVSLLAIVVVLIASLVVVPEARAQAAPPAPQAQRAPVTEAADVPSARSTARLNGRPIEALAERTEASTVTVNPDGTVSTELHVAPVRTKLGEAWVPVDLTLVRAGTVIRAKAHPRDLTLAAGGTDGLVDVATVKRGDTEVALQWKGKLPAPELAGDTATYRGVRPGADLVIRATRTGFVPSLQGAKPEFSYRTKGIEQRPDADVSLWDGPSAVGTTDADGRSLRVGGADKATSSLRFDLGFLRGKRVLDAKVWLLPTKSASCDKRRIELWDAAQRAAAPAGVKDVGCESGWVATDVPALAQRAADKGGAAALDVKTSDDPAAAREFSSAEGAGVPRMTVTANTPPAPANGMDVSDRGDGGGAVYTRTATPTLSFRPSDPDGDQVSAIFYIYEGNSIIATQLMPNVVSGSLVSWTVPSGVLQNNKSYRFRAAVYDGADVGEDAWFVLRDQHNPNLVAQPENCAQTDGAKIVLAAANGSACQQFALLPRDGYQMVLNRETHKVVDNTGCSGNSGNPVQQVTGSWGDCQRWKLEPQGDGVYQLPVKNSGKLLEHGCSTAGRQLTVKDRTGGSCERWTLDIANPEQIEWLPFTVSVQAPAPPIVNSAEYPNDGTWNRGAGQPGTFTLSPVAGTTGITHYVWGLDANPTTEVAAGPDGRLTVSATPPTDGVHVLHVRVKNVAGQLSAVNSYGFNVGRAGLLLPADGARVFRTAKLQVQAEPSLTHVKFVYRRGPGAAAEYDVPAANLRGAGGGTFSTGYVPLSGMGPFAVWNATDTLGTAAGVVQIKAVLATDVNGSGAYPTDWRNAVVDPNADGAEGSSVGPGSVNLQTGDYTISGGDADEFGLSVSRTTSSRDPKAGYQAQHERLSQNQQQVNQDTNGFEPRNTSLRRATDRGHTGNDSLELTPTGGGADTYATVGPEHGALRFGMQPGGTYRFSAWIYVPAASGLAPPDGRGLRLQATVHTPAGYTAFESVRPTVTDAWVEVTVDIPVPAGADMAYLRIYNGFAAGSGKKVCYDDLTLREIVAPFGPQWSSGVSTASGVDYTRLTFPQATSARLEDANGSSTWFTKAADGKYVPELGAEGLTLVADGANFKVSELDGTVNVFSRQTGDTSVPYLLTTTTPPSAAAVTQFRYEFVREQVRLKRVIGPIETGVGDCTAATPARGCEALEYDYASATTATATAFGDFRDRVRAISVWSTDPATGVVSAMEISRYVYDDQGRLREVWDPRGGAGLPKLRYDYDPAGRVVALTPGDELQWKFDYGTAGTGDPNTGRLLRVRRDTLRQGTADQVDGEVATTIVYGVPLDRPAGGPYNMTASWVATWGQDEAATDATAVFGPEDPVAVNTATASVPGPNGYRAATVHYLDASGRGVNVAAPNGEIDSKTYDRFGNTVRSLEATNRALALAQYPGSREQLSELGLLQYDTKARSAWLDSRSTYSADGIDVISTRGPVHRVVLPERPDTLVSARLVTESAYDEGKPDSQAYHLQTSTTSYAEIVGELGRYDSRVHTNQYTPSIGGTSGWTLRTPTKVVGNKDRPTAMSAQVRYDPSGRAVESRKFGAATYGGDARTTKSIFYTAGPNTEDAACGNRPEWAGQGCVTKAAGAVTGHDATRMTTDLPVKRVLAYDRFGEPTVVAETAAGVTRTTETTYDLLGRVLATKITGGTGAAIPEIRTTYDALTGESVRTEYAGGSAVTRQHDRLGRLIRYTDADGGWTAGEYDRFNKPVKTTDSLGTTQTVAYDRAKEPRGFPTSFTDSVAGVMEPVYGPDGQLTSFTMPGGVKMTQQYDPAGVPVVRKYERDGTLIAGSSALINVHGQTVRHTAPGSDKKYTYDDLGRLTRAEDTSASSGLCTVRGYSYDSRSNRTGKTVRRGQTAAECPADSVAPQSSTSHTYDTADRMTDPGWVYDVFGRITSTPDGLANSFYVNDLVASQTKGTDRKSWTLDPALRFRKFTSERLVNGAWAETVTKVNHYDDDSDEPRWITEDVTQPDNVTRNVEGPDDDLAITTGKTGNVVLQMTSLHGDVMATAPLDAGVLGAITVQDNDEFGIPSDETPAAATARYGWLGGKQRSAEALGGVILMGVRLYHPETGRFLSVDPVPGGSLTAYDYCGADPINCTDLDGKDFWGWVKNSVAPVVAKVAEVASYIPGPIGVVAGAVSAGAYAVSGNYRKAKEMAIGAIASLVPGGKFIAKAVGGIAKAVGRVAVKAAKALRGCNSFSPDTAVLMADGSARPISTIDVGDQVAAVDPATGQVGARSVVDVIVGYGDKHLIQFTVEGETTPVTATAGHPIWVDGKGWTETEKIGIGDRVLLPGGATASIHQIRDLGLVHGSLVYNLTVSGLHTFMVFAGIAPVLVHNASCALIGQAAKAPRVRGVYTIKYKDGSAYIGKSRNMHRRMHQHAKNGKLNDVASIRYVQRGRGSLRKLEQGTMNRHVLAGVKLRNKIKASRRYARY